MAEPVPLQLGESITVLFPLRVRGPSAPAVGRSASIPIVRARRRETARPTYWCLRRCFSARRGEGAGRDLGR